MTRVCANAAVEQSEDLEWAVEKLYSTQQNILWISQPWTSWWEGNGNDASNIDERGRMVVCGTNHELLKASKLMKNFLNCTYSSTVRCLKAVLIPNVVANVIPNSDKSISETPSGTPLAKLLLCMRDPSLLWGQKGVSRSHAVIRLRTNPALLRKHVHWTG